MQRAHRCGVIDVLETDITLVAVDAIVTAANAELRGGGGVDGAVHRAAGPRLLEALRPIGGCPTGRAVITDAFDLSGSGVRYVIHAVGPIWRGGDEGEESLLDSAYQSALKLAEQHALTSIAFPAISAGVYGYPLESAARVAVTAAWRFLSAGPRHLRRIVFALFDDRSHRAFENALAGLPDSAN